MIGTVRRMRTVTPVLPSEIGSHAAASLTRCGSPSRDGPRRRRDPARRRIVQGEPPRLRPRGARRRGWRRSPSTSEATARATARWTAVRSRTWSRWRRSLRACDRRRPGPDRAARLEHGRLPGDPVPPGRRAPRRRGDLPGERARACGGGCASGAFEFDADAAALDRVARRQRSRTRRSRRSTMPAAAPARRGRRAGAGRALAGAGRALHPPPRAA